MEREANLPAPPATANSLLRSSLPNPNPSRSFSSSSSPPDFLWHVQAAFKRHRPLGTMQSSSIGPRRVFVPRREQSKVLASDSGLTVETEKSQDVILSGQAKTVSDLIEQKKSVVAIVGETRDDSLVTPPSITGTITKSYDHNLNPFGVQSDQTNPVVDGKRTEIVSSSSFVSQHVPVMDGHKKVQFSLDSNVNSQRADERMATRTDDLSSHMGSLSLTEMEWDVSNREEISAVSNHDLKQRDYLNSEALDATLRSDGGISSLLAKRGALVQDQQQQFTEFLRSDISHPMAQSSVMGLSCATTTSVHSTSAPMLNMTTYSSRSHRDSSSHMEIETLEENVNPQSKTVGDRVQPSYPTFQCINGTLAEQSVVPTLGSICTLDTSVEVKDTGLSKEQQCCGLKERDRLGNQPVDHPNHSSHFDDKSNKGNGFSGDVSCVQSQAPLEKNTSNLKLEPSKLEKPGKAVSGKGPSAPRKKSYDPDLFFKVSGKLYQKLGKIGSGGSSEVHKVISSDCTIYALKKIKLKGRDYSTAYGFCQEIEYLNKLKGKDNIIQLIDFEASRRQIEHIGEIGKDVSRCKFKAPKVDGKVEEDFDVLVTDKTLLQEVMNGSMSIKDGRIKDDGYIYMVLEYGEIDLAHMLSQKWKEIDSSNWSIDENWLRFYWQQILQAVNTIHEERIVHSDLKPANFLLVKGSLKLIDFGIAKAIMSDTTNIQRDSQVGTLSYMSPEAFMCNENDANGNTIKCGRPSDIWSLGCILYQMVYGRTPFAEYKTFWAKFKVITDRNHEITYCPVSNPWLLDLMKKCLAWDRNERWRIPQLLQHPFLVPPIPSQVSSSQDHNCKLLQLMAEAYGNDHEASTLCSQLQQLLTNPVSSKTSSLSTSRDQHCKLLLQISSLCSQLQQHLTNLGRDG